MCHLHHHTAELCEIAEGKVFGYTDKTDVYAQSHSRTHASIHTVHVAMVSSIMHRHFMFMQLTGQDRAMDTVDVNLAHTERRL